MLKGAWERWYPEGVRGRQTSRRRNRGYHGTGFDKEMSKNVASSGEEGAGKNVLENKKVTRYARDCLELCPLDHRQKPYPYLSSRSIDAKCLTHRRLGTAKPPNEARSLYNVIYWKEVTSTSGVTKWLYCERQPGRVESHWLMETYYLKSFTPFQLDGFHTY